jgi:tRNA pseudouridine32 synthase/23S rRNA pseudouridine746 synthase
MTQEKEFIYNPPKEPFLDILYEDDNIIVVDKPSGLLSVPGKALEHNDSILSRVRSLAPEANAVHRLDMSTSGIIVVAKNKLCTGRLGKQFQERKTGKIYYAWLGGKLEQQEGIVNLPLCTDWENRPLQHVDYENGREAITHYIVLWQDEERTFVRLKPHTGRSHQLRVHMAHPHSLSASIVGDEIYGTPGTRLMLHATSVTFTHPITNEYMRIEVTPPF